MGIVNYHAGRKKHGLLMAAPLIPSLFLRNAKVAVEGTFEHLLMLIRAYWQSVMQNKCHIDR